MTDKEKNQKAEDLYSSGIHFLQSKQYSKALDYFLKVLKILPKHAASLNSIGFINKKSGKKDEAIEYFLKAIEIDSKNHIYYYNIANTFYEQEKYLKAIEYYIKAIELNSNISFYFSELGISFFEIKDFQTAKICFSNAIKINSYDADNFNNLGLCNHKLKELDLSIDNFSKAIKLNSNNPIYYNNIGLVFNDLKDYEEAIFYFFKASKLDPRNSEYYNNKGISLYRKGFYLEAIDSYKFAIKLSPEISDYYNNLGLAFEDIGQLNYAFENYEKSLELNPNNNNALKNIMCLHLLLQRFDDAEKYIDKSYENTNITNLFKNTYKTPEWNYDNLNGKTLLIHCDQGFGDSIQFIRYLENLKKYSGKIIVNCQNELIDLFRSIGKEYTFISKSIFDLKDIKFDYYKFLTKIPFSNKNILENIPQKTPYLKLKPEFSLNWKKKLNNFKGKKVGIVWNSKYTFSSRSCPISNFIDIFNEFNEFQFISLQKEISLQENKLLSTINNIDLNIIQETKNFEDTGGILKNLDFLISVDTSVAHLAGALGIKTYLLLSFIPSWRWFLEDSNTIWYSNMSIIRQQDPQNWESVIHKLHELIKKEYFPESKNEKTG